MKYWVVSFVILLAACSNGNINPDVAPLTVALTNTAKLPNDSTKSVTPIPTQTNIFPTQTPAPILSAEAVDDRVLELLHTNADCSLPCWWGITPGITTTDEIQSILEPFLGAIVSEVRYEFSETGGHLLMRPQPQNGLKVGIQYLAKDNIVTMVYVNTEMTRNTYDLIYDDPFYQESLSAYTLKSVLTKYGKPDQILIRSFSYLAADFKPTQILLYYPNQGIVAQYFSRNLPEIEGQGFINLTCPTRSHISLRLFNPNSQITLDELLVVDDSFRKYKDVSDVTNMDVETFYQTYLAYDEDALNSSCYSYIKTPWDVWPDEYRNP